MIIGIDFGTTLSAVAYVDNNNNCIVIENELGSRLTPSYILFKHDNISIGEYAMNNVHMYPKNTVYDIKRFIGKEYDKNDIKYMSYEIINQDNSPIVNIDNNKYSPTKLASLIINHMKIIAESHLGHVVEKAVITVPAYFNDRQRQEIREAGKLANMEVVRIINEPSAAALACNITQGTIMVYDIGGGTLDVTILNVNDDVYEVLSSCGDANLGGQDFDNKLLEYCLIKYITKNILTIQLDKEDKTILLNLFNISSLNEIFMIDINIVKKYMNTGLYDDYLLQLHEAILLYKNDKMKRKLKSKCENAKKELSLKLNTQIIYECFYNDDDLIIDISRTEFENICTNEFKKCINPVYDALLSINMNKDDINNVIIIGGSSRIPKIHKLLVDYFGDKIIVHNNPDEVVVRGAAIQAGIIDSANKVNNNNELLLIDISNSSFGIETVDSNGIKTIDTLIKKNNPLPCSVSKIYSTKADNQSSVTIKIYENDKHMGHFTISNIPPMNKYIPKIEITFIINIDGILIVSAVEKISNIKGLISFEK